MKNNRSYSFILALASLCFVSAKLTKTEGSDNPCLKEVKAIYDKMYTVLPKENVVYHFKYTVISTLLAKDKAGKNIVSRSDIELFTSRGQYRFISKDIEVYQDKENKFTVLPLKKIVYWAESDMNPDNAMRMDRTKRIQDTIFHYARVTDCQALKQDPSTKAVSVKLEPKFAEYMGIKKVIYTYNAVKHELKRLQIEYPETKEIIALEFLFDSPDYNYTKIQFTPVIKNFIEGKNKLKENYKDFQLIDVRQNK